MRITNFKRQGRTELRRKTERKKIQNGQPGGKRRPLPIMKNRKLYRSKRLKIKKVAFDSAQVIPFEEPICEEVGVGTVTLVAKQPPPYEIRTNRSPEKFDERKNAIT